MSFTASLEEGKAIIQSVKVLEDVTDVPPSIIGVLKFAINVNDIPYSDVQEMFEDFQNVDYDIDLNIEDLRWDGFYIKVVKFERYITADLLPQIRAVVDKYCGAYYQGKLLYWKYDQ